MKIHLSDLRFPKFCRKHAGIFLIPVCSHFCGLDELVLLALILIVGLNLFWISKKEEKRLLFEEKVKDGFFYMEQMIYSFKKQHKILNSLADVENLSEDELQRSIRRAIRTLSDSMDSDLFEAALKLIEDYAGSTLMHNLHIFLIHVELQGGECDEALELLLGQLASCEKLEQSCMKQIEGIRKKLKLAVLLSCMILICVRRLFPDWLNLEDMKIYQILMGIGFAIFSFMYAGFSCLQASAITEAAIDYSNEELSEKKFRFQNPFRNKQKAERMREAFPVWMYEMLLRLQTENIETAVRHSMDHVPLVLAKPLYEFLESIRENPVSKDPYREFLKEYHLPEVKCMMLQLYAVNLMGRDEISRQIEILLRQSQNLKETTASLQLENRTALTGFLIILPMGICFCLMVFTLILMMLGMLSNFGSQL